MKDKSVIGCIFSEDRKRVLLIKKRDVPVWVLPGGKIEKGEEPETTIIREILEETGFHSKIVRKVGEYTPANRLTRQTHLYECTIISGQATLGKETKDLHFFPISSLPKLLPPPYKEWIEDTFQSLPMLIQKELKNVTYLDLIKNLFLHPLLVIRFLLSRLGIKINT